MPRVVSTVSMVLESVRVMQYRENHEARWTQSWLSDVKGGVGRGGGRRGGEGRGEEGRGGEGGGGEGRGGGRRGGRDYS